MADSTSIKEKKAKKARKITRRRGNVLEEWEAAIVKAMIDRESYNDQDILAYFTRPARSVNHRVISEIRSQKRHESVKAADGETLNDFLTTWPHVDSETGLNTRGDELLIKAREAMIAAVHNFNSAGLTFRTELFIVSAIIAWTYLLHAWFKREGICYRYPSKTTKEGAYKYWDLSKCLKQPKCPAKGNVVKNLEFLIELRNEIEHQSTNRIDDAVGANLQSCCINFNDLLKNEFGDQYSLEKRLPIALQFVSFSPDQRSILKKASSLPPHVSSFIDAFEHRLTKEQFEDPAYRMKVAFVPVVAKRAGAADSAVEFVAPGSEKAEAIGQVIFKEMNRKRYPPGDVVKKVQAAGYPTFNMHNHTQLWKSLKAKTEGNQGYGCKGDYKDNWVWFDTWIDCVLKHCEELGDKYKAPPQIELNLAQQGIDEPLDRPRPPQPDAGDNVINHGR